MTCYYRMSFFAIVHFFFSKLLEHLMVCIVIAITPICLYFIAITPIVIAKTPFVASLVLFPRTHSYPVSFIQPKYPILIYSPWCNSSSSFIQHICCALHMAVSLHIPSVYAVVIILTVPPSRTLCSTMYVIIHLSILLAHSNNTILHNF